MPLDISNTIYANKIDAAAAWMARQIGGKSSLSHAVDPELASILWALVDQTSHIRTDAITTSDFDHPRVRELAAHVRQDLHHGRGAVLLTGISLDNRSAEDFGRLHWGLGTHIGRGAPQSPRGDHVCRVEHTTDVKAAGAGYLRNIELLPHSDHHEILALAGYERAETGGETGLTSSLSVHNACLEEGVGHLEALYEGYYYVLAGSEEVSQTKAPLFCNIDGKVSLAFNFGHYDAAARLRGEQLPPALTEAIGYVLRVAANPDLRIAFAIDRGEILYWHNFLLLHSRLHFDDAPNRKRLLLRLWLHAHESRPMHPSFSARARAVDRVNKATG